MDKIRFSLILLIAALFLNISCTSKSEDTPQEEIKDSTKAQPEEVAVNEKPSKPPVYSEDNPYVEATPQDDKVIDLSNQPGGAPQNEGKKFQKITLNDTINEQMYKQYVIEIYNEMIAYLDTDEFDTDLNALINAAPDRIAELRAQNKTTDEILQDAQFKFMNLLSKKDKEIALRKYFKDYAAYHTIARRLMGDPEFKALYDNTYAKVSKIQRDYMAKFRTFL